MAGVRLELLPGKRAGMINMLKQIRETRTAEGLRVSNVIETRLGQGGVLVRTTGYENIDAWAESVFQPQPANVQEIFDLASKDPNFPYVATSSSRLLARINL